MKKIHLISVALIACVLAFCKLGFSECHGGKCPLKGSGRRDGAQQEMHQCPIVAKIMKKSHLYLENQKELGLQEDQIKVIKAIMMETKKAEIRQMAEMQVFQIDLKTKLSEEQVDSEGLNKMIDGMASGMASSAKAAVASYVKLKLVLSVDQQSKLKEIWLQNKAEEYAH